jgi:hypothetical protein
LTIRDYDEFPQHSTISRGMPLKQAYSYFSSYNHHFNPGFRVASAHINYLLVKTFHTDIFKTKRIVGLILIFLYIPIFLSIAQRIRLTVPQQLTALSLFLSNACIFATYDTLSPYFLFVVLTSLQFLSLFDYMNNRQSHLFYFSLSSILAMLCSWLAIIPTTILLFLLFFNYKKDFYKKKGYLIPLLLILLFLLINLLSFVYYLIIVDKLFLKLDVYPLLEFYYFKISNVKDILYFLSPLTAFLPTFLLGHSFFFIYQIILSAILFGVLFLFNNEKESLLDSYTLLLTAGYLLLFSIYTLFNFFYYKGLFNPGLYIYALPVTPFLIILFVKKCFLHIQRKTILLIMFIPIIILNFNTGYSFRKEAFNYLEYKKHIETIASEKIKFYTIPSFIIHGYQKIVLNELTSPAKKEGRRPIDEKRYLSEQAPHYVIIAEYKELGCPWYNYDYYEKKIESNLLRENIIFRKKQYPTFVSYYIKPTL